ncbi:hypothetical protein AHMF7605_12715 [Adhaeribacter arboris]|uniref:Uncharacterized protein n=1 Tax=Adhaeribacter arboris TaxID=2072846 RepID=A0A2T2YFN1_9BACT|nr:hypothetical protein [Adhaeribacter arboris]PSR54317.1 hypothetical protein AHMF7605_12715 [Adhaeribacter arboris]
MEAPEKKEVLAFVNKAHSLVEKTIFASPNSQRLSRMVEQTAADLSLHLVQASVAGEQMKPDLLKRYLYSILTIAQDFLPEIDLNRTAEQLITAQLPEPELMPD